MTSSFLHSILFLLILSSIYLCMYHLPLISPSFPSLLSFVDFPCLALLLGFIGADTFQFVYAGSLLALNTFGGEICMMVTVLAVVRGLRLGQGIRQGIRQGLGQEIPSEEEHENVQDNPILQVGSLRSEKGKQGNNLTGAVTSDLTGSAVDLTGSVVDLTGSAVDLTGSALAHWCGYRLWLLAATAGA